MKLSSKTAGFGIMAVAGLMLCTAAIADNMGQMPGMDDMEMGGMGMGMMMHGPMMDLTAMDANKDGKVSKDEMTAYRTAQTTAVDANGDGKLSVDELAAMHLKAMTEAAKTMAQKMVERMDTDGDGMLSAAELIAPPMPAGMFDKLDTNKDGFIDQAELDAAGQSMMMRGGHHGGKHGDHMMGAPDQNGMGGN